MKDTLRAFLKNCLLAATLCLGLWWPSPAGADSSFRCGDSLVSVGDTTYTVMSECGSPDTREIKVTEEKRTSRKKTRKVKKVVIQAGNRYDGQTSGDETWYYDCGTDQFLYVLTFTNSRLTNIQANGRGTRRGLPCPMSSPWTTRKEMVR
jgi:hypothetical protein